jgi:hypothetical protein
MMVGTVIDVSGLPEQVVKDIQKLVQTIRDKLAVGPMQSPSPVTLPRWGGTVIGKLERREIYDDGE